MKFQLGIIICFKHLSLHKLLTTCFNTSGLISDHVRAFELDREVSDNITLKCSYKCENKVNIRMLLWVIQIVGQFSNPYPLHSQHRLNEFISNNYASSVLMNDSLCSGETGVNYFYLTMIGLDQRLQHSAVHCGIRFNNGSEDFYSSAISIVINTTDPVPSPTPMPVPCQVMTSSAVDSSGDMPTSSVFRGTSSEISSTSTPLGTEQTTGMISSPTAANPKVTDTLTGKLCSQ